MSSYSKSILFTSAIIRGIFVIYPVTSTHYMAVSKEKKSEILAILEQHLKESVSVGFTSNTGLTALDVFTMKRELRAANTTFMLAKKTLMRLAFKNVHGVDLDLDTLPGQVAIIFSK